MTMFDDLGFTAFSLVFSLIYLVYRFFKNSYLASVSLQNLEDEEFEQLKRNLKDITDSSWNLFCYLGIAFLCHFMIEKFFN